MTFFLYEFDEFLLMVVGNVVGDGHSSLVGMGLSRHRLRLSFRDTIVNWKKSSHVEPFATIHPRVLCFVDLGAAKLAQLQYPTCAHVS